MSGLREKKKKEAKEKILKAARLLFPDKGFNGTTTDLIAETAEVSVGTIYNHYRTKEEIFIDALFGSFNVNKKENDLVIPEKIDNSTDFLNEYTGNYIGQLIQFGKPILRELMKAGFNSSNTGSGLIEHLMALDWKMMEIINRIISAMEKSDNQKENVRFKSEIVFSIMAFEFMRYIYEDSYKNETLVQNIKKKIDILFH